MKILFDFFPVIIFFIIYKWTGDIIMATAVLIPATLLQIGYTWFKTKKLEKMQLATLVLVVLLGGATIIFHDKTFIQWKPTVVNWLFGAVFLGSQFIGSKTVVQRIMESSITLPSETWRILNMGWTAFFLLMGGLNLVVAYSFSEETWVNFKLFGMLGLTIVFIIAQGVYISRKIPEQDRSE